jgi:hypothetical protein
MDVSNLQNPLPSGIYRLSRLVSKGIANMDAWIVKITTLSDISDAPTLIVKRWPNRNRFRNWYRIAFLRHRNRQFSYTI